MRVAMPLNGNGIQSARGVRDRVSDLTRIHQRWLAPVALALLALALFVPRLGVPNQFVFDELYYAHTAGEYVDGDADAYRSNRPPRDKPAIEWTHPPVAKLLIAGGILAFGDTPIGWRAVNVLFGVAGVLLTFQLGRTLSGNLMVGVGAAVLLMLDGLYFVESRTGMSNLFLLVFSAAALLSFTSVLAAGPDDAGIQLALTGLFLGLALATKWSSVALLGLIGLAYLWRSWRDSDEASSGLFADLARGAGAFVGIPIAVYALSYAHFFATGHDWGDFVALHRAMLQYHRDLGVVHSYSSSWWEWPLAARPVWYYASRSDSIGSFVFANGNPLLYWPMVVAVAWVAIDWWGRRSTPLIILTIGFFGQWLPWAFSPRGTFVYHFLPAVPFGCIALAVVVTDAWKNGHWQRGAAVGYLIAVVAVFAFFYPLYTAWPLGPEQVGLRMWLPSWR